MARVKYFDPKDGVWKYADSQFVIGSNPGGNAEDGFSPIATVTQTASGAVISITDKTGTTTATITNGKDGKDGADGAPGEKGDTGATGAPGNPGKDGKDGTSATHSWNGTVLTITSASGTSSADLKGEKGDKGDKGDTGATGAKGDPGSPGADGKPGAPGADGKPGADGYTPVRGVDYYTEADKAEFSTYITTELTKRGQLTPEYADSIEECTDTTKLYVLPDGMIYAYALTEVTEGGYTNLADPTSPEWLTKQRYNASHALTSASESNAFVSNVIPCKPEDIIRIKNVQDSSGTGSTKAWFRIAGCKNDGTLVNGKAYYPTRDYAAVSGTSCYGAVTVSEDGVCSYPVLYIHYSENSVKQAVSGDAVSTFVGVRIAGCYVGSAENVIITVNEEIVEPTTTTGYRWVNTGHAFVPADYEDRIIDLENDAARLDRKIDTEVSKLQNQIDSGEASAKSGAKWFALGDSITQGYIGYIKDDGSAGCKMASSSCWVKLVSEMNGYELTNYGVGGTGYAHGDNNARAVVNTIDFTQCDFVTLAYGVNDWKYSAPIGTMDDDIETGGTMVSNMRYVIKKIMQDNPICKLFVITPINCKPSANFTYETNWGIDSGSKGLLNGYGLSEIYELMQQVCRYHGIEMIDMTFNSCVNRENLETILPDGVHPSVEGHKLMARELAQKITFR